MIKKILIPVILIIGTLTSCQTVSPTSELPGVEQTSASGAETEAEPSVTIANPTVTPSPTPVPPRVLSICMGEEPASLFIYGDTTAAARGILEAIYDGPFDRQNGEILPVILQQTPSIENGGAALLQVEVSPGELIADNQGSLTVLEEGAIYRPSGCTNPGCAVSYSGTDPVIMDELVVQFEIVPGVSWSDGTSLSAQDSVFAYRVVRSAFNNSNFESVRFAKSYRAEDELSVVWHGIPGYQGSRYRTFFFSPLPEHLYGQIPMEELFTSETSSQMPIGWGPYRIDEWIRGDHITLSRNPSYFRSDEGLPKFDFLVYRFVSDPLDALTAFDADECDLIDQTALDESQYASLVERQKNGDLDVLLQIGTAWEQITFGIESVDINRPDFFALRETRQAVAQCLDRSAIAQAAFPIEAEIPSSYVMPGDPMFNPGVEEYRFDPSAAQELLQSVGWIDHDENPATPRSASGVPGVLDGTSFEVTYLVPDDEIHPQVAEIAASNLAACGIQVEISPQSMDELFAPGPEGVVFGRQFDLVQFAWISSDEPSCDLYTTAEIPGPFPEFPRSWGGGNASGYSNPEYDRACYQGLFSLPDDPAYREGHDLAQLIFTQDLPALPLYQMGRIAVSRPDLCGVDPVSGINIVWEHLEDIDYGDGCED